MQWGRSTKTGTVTVQFPKTFSSVYIVTVTTHANIGESDTTCTYDYTNTSFKSNNIRQFVWFALGIS